ncbi:MAG: hypothetical protein HN353_01295 [Bdellovibrionales bacterium]|jgi:hypothetical protein|nr:hypothetical protein [Bdellovibrionales bacterium]MBT3526696.1 hypothetical protein [Bdellovibrionales bacterium]MBT7668464.1 hypothetical protein [Bdellovibrionales bacterium]
MESAWDIYLMGVAASVLFNIFSFAIYRVVTILTGEAVYYANLMKMGLYKHSSTGGVHDHPQPPIKTIIVITTEVVLSWIGVLSTLYTIFETILGGIRHIRAKHPDDIQRIRYPLFNLPLPVESVWAHLVAIETMGRVYVADVDMLHKGVIRLQHQPPRQEDGSYADPKKALELLRDLDVVDGKIIDEVLRKLEKQN